MSIAAQKRGLWPRQTAIVVSQSPNVHMLLRELLRSYQWTVIDSTPSVEKAVSAVKQGLAYLIIVDDTIEVPAVTNIRYLLTDPVAAVTPVLSFLLDHHKGEQKALRHLGQPEIVDKPLTPSKFVPGFVNLVKRWETEPYLTLRRANYQFLNGNDQTGLKHLLGLKDNTIIQHLVAQALSLHMRRIGKVKEAETFMLSVLKRSPRDLGTMLSLGDLYMHAAMPSLAHRLFNGARNAFPTSLSMLPDLVQAALLKGDIDLSIRYLEEMFAKEFFPEATQSFLARLLYSEGREGDAERVLNNNRASFRRIQIGWEQAETVPSREAS